MQISPDYNLDRIDQRARPYDSRYTYFSGGTGVIAYVIDSGLKFEHNDFRVGTSWRNFFSDSCRDADADGHGTAVADLLGGIVRGAAKDVQLRGFKVASCADGLINLQAVLSAISLVEQEKTQAPNTPVVVNMSFGEYDPGYTLQTLDQAVYDLIHTYDVTVVCAVGQIRNVVPGASAGSQNNWTVGRVNGTLAIGMTESTDRKIHSNISNYAQAFGSFIDLFAPGWQVRVADGRASAPLSAERIESGTSFATPLAAGVAALYLQNNPYAHFYQVRGAILDFVTLNRITNLATGDPNKLLYEPFGMPATFNAASFARGVAPDSLAVIFSNPLPAIPTRVTIENNFGVEIQVQTSLVSTTQINYLIPSTIPASSVQTVRVYAGTTLIGHGTAAVNRLASALFSANGQGSGLVSGQLLRVDRANPDNQTYEDLTIAGNELRPDTEDNYLILYGTGFRLRSSVSAVALTFDGISIPVTFAGAQGSPGLDQVNAGPLPASLKGRINKDLILSVEGQIANIVKASFL